MESRSLLQNMNGLVCKIDDGGKRFRQKNQGAASRTMVIPPWVVDWLEKAYCCSQVSHSQTSIQFRPIFTFGRYDRTVPDKAST